MTARTMKQKFEPVSILISGASSGIGEALALAYSRPGRHLALIGRNRARLDNVAGKCRELGAAIASATISVTDRQRSEDWIGQVDDRHPLDLVIANAGIAGTGDGELGADVREVFDVNVLGVFNTIDPALKRLRVRQRGQIAIMSSLAAFRGGLGDLGYGASKAAVKLYGEGLRIRLRHENIWVSVICPGYVQSRMTACNDFPMPFLMEPERAAKIITKGLAKNQPLIAFPWRSHTIAWLARALPASLGDMIFSSPRCDDPRMPSIFGALTPNALHVSRNECPNDGH